MAHLTILSYSTATSTFISTLLNNVFHAYTIQNKRIKIKLTKYSNEELIKTSMRS